MTRRPTKPTSATRPGSEQHGQPPDAPLLELLSVCEEFLRAAAPAVHAELRTFLTARGYHPIAGLPAFLDQLQFTVHLRI